MDSGRDIGSENRKGAFRRLPVSNMAEWTGLEPATSGVTGQHSNQLNYHSALKNLCDSRLTGYRCIHPEVVGAEGFEPPTLSV